MIGDLRMEKSSDVTLCHPDRSGGSHENDSGDTMIFELTMNDQCQIRLTTSKPLSNLSDS